MPDPNRLSPAWSTNEATAELREGVGKPAMDAARAWLQKHEPELLALHGEPQVVDSAIQAVIQAQTDGNAVAFALAHNFAVFIGMQPNRDAAIRGLLTEVQEFLHEMDEQVAAVKADTAGKA